MAEGADPRVAPSKQRLDILHPVQFLVRAEARSITGYSRAKMGTAQQEGAYKPGYKGNWSHPPEWEFPSHKEWKRVGDTV